MKESVSGGGGSSAYGEAAKNISIPYNVISAGSADQPVILFVWHSLPLVIGNSLPKKHGEKRILRHAMAKAVISYRSVANGYQ